MGNKKEYKKMNIRNCTFYYFDDIMEVEDINVDRILLGKKSYENKNL